MTPASEKDTEPMHRTIRFLSAAAVAALATAAAFSARPEAPQRAAEPPPRPEPNSADEPFAKSPSLAKSADFLDAVAVRWTQEHNCGTCHTNYPYLMARPCLSDGTGDAMAEVRKFFEGRAAGWDKDDPKAQPRNDTEVVATAAALAFNDAQTTGKLHPLTRAALDRMWTLQRDDGAWEWAKCTWPPFEFDDYYGAVFAAVGVGAAPDGYAATDKAKAGLAKLRKYFEKTPPPNLHHKAWLLWASQKVDGLMTAEEREKAVKELRALQHKDGGWSLASLADWKGFDGRKNDPDAPSDGYGTGMVVYVLRQSGVAADDEAVQRGVKWLKENQRESGRWFTRSLNTDRAHYITNAGTAFAVMALKACEAPEKPRKGGAPP
jgi:squalene-hopene/tetraprenyl-beta-curcumene cyclase